MYEIEKNVPFPGTLRHKYPFDSMEVGDSFFVPLSQRRNVQQAMTLENRKGNRRYRARTTYDESGARGTADDASGVRVWRIE